MNMGLATGSQYRTRRISAKGSAALNGIRALAAVYVVAHHIVINSSFHGAWTYAFRFGQEAVIVFFLLSGFVIFASEHRRVSDLRGYYLRRLRRIYPPLLVAFALAAVVVTLNGTIGRDFNPWALTGNLLSLQDVSGLKPGVITDPFLGNSPLWSLSYEVFFYAVFPLVMVARRVSRRFALNAVGALAILGYATYLAAPNHFSLVVAYLLVWWAGAFLADLYRSSELSFRSAAPLFAWLGALCVAALIGVALMRHGKIDPGVFPALPLRHFFDAAVFALLAVAAPTRKAIRSLWRGGPAAAYLASISYGLYVFHYPLLIEWDWASTPAGFAMAGVLLIVVSILGDRMMERLLPKPRSR